MGQVILRNVDDLAIQRLKERARRKGVSLEHELRTIATEAFGSDRAGFRARASELRRQLTTRVHSDSTELVREDRDR